MEKHLRFGVWLTELSHPYHNFPTSRSRDMGAGKHSRTGRLETSLLQALGSQMRYMCENAFNNLYKETAIGNSPRHQEFHLRDR